jgi:hypothetical protein
VTRTRTAACAAVLALAAGCAQPPAGGNRTAAPDSAADSSLAGMLRLERARGAPGDTVAGYARYTVAWPDPERIPGSSALAESLRAAIAWHAAEGQLDAAGRPLPPDSLAERFLAGHAQFVAEFPGGPREWNIDRTITLETLPFGLSTLRIDDARYEGGAHGMAATFWRSYDPRTGAVLRLADVADAAGRDSLRVLGERAFRAAREIPPGADLKEAGFFLWEAGGFELSENFGVTRAGLVFHWNPYDIAAYAAGPTEITLPWDAVQRFLRADGPLGAARTAR